MNKKASVLTRSSGSAAKGKTGSAKVAAPASKPRQTTPKAELPDLPLDPGPSQTDVSGPDENDHSYELIRRVAAAQSFRGHSIYELSEELGLSYGYTSALLKSPARLRSASREVFVKIAAYIDASVAQVYVWSGALETEDFIHRNQSSEAALDRAWQSMSRDPAYLLAPSFEDWTALPQKVRLFMVLLYQQASGLQFLPPLKVPPPTSSS